MLIAHSRVDGLQKIGSLVSLDPLRGLHLTSCQVKPQDWLRQKATLEAADVVLFPQSWQVNVLHHVLRKALFPNVASYRLGWDKVEMTRAFEFAVPEAVPPTLILPANPVAAEEAADTLGFPLVVKHPRHSMGRGVELIEDMSQLLRWTDNANLLYAQAYLENDGDVRVVWVGREVVAAYWRRNPGSFHNNVARGGQVDFSSIPQNALELVERTALRLGIDHAGFDVILVDGHPFLLEFNVLFGNEALNQAGISLTAPILRYLQATYGGIHPTPRAA